MFDWKPTKPKQQIVSFVKYFIFIVVKTLSSQRNRKEHEDRITKCFD